MNKKIPKKLLNSKYRSAMWENVQKIINKVENAVPISSAYMMGSFVTKKKRPSDIDFIVLLQTPEKKSKAKWSVDLVIAPDNEYGTLTLKETKKWMEEKFGSKNCEFVKLI